MGMEEQGLGERRGVSRSPSNMGKIRSHCLRMYVWTVLLNLYDCDNCVKWRPRLDRLSEYTYLVPAASNSALREFKTMLLKLHISLTARAIVNDTWLD
jgi:hypothetical protein